jgi:hypothetical protein
MFSNNEYHEMEAELKAEIARLKAELAQREPHWLVKDFNALYRAALAFSEACMGRGDGKPYAHHEALAQLERLRPAFQDTEVARRLAREDG